MYFICIHNVHVYKMQCTCMYMCIQCTYMCVRTSTWIYDASYFRVPRCVSWMTYELDLINYQNKCRLIRGWDDLFNKVKEHINSVAAMKLSPYFKVFEDDAMAWEDRLNRINALFDVWIDVQRRWVYLEGIFTGSADIKHLLPNESQRFQRFVIVYCTYACVLYALCCSTCMCIYT